MAHRIDISTLSIIHPSGKTVGTGFLVAQNLAATCAHVVMKADAYKGDIIQVRFTGQTTISNAVVLAEFWSDLDEFDVAILRVENLPEGVYPLPMGHAGTCSLNAPVYTFGYAVAAGEKQLSGYGEFRNLPRGSKVFQFRMHEANYGHSGAPILDLNRHVIIGMIQKGTAETGRNAETTFGVPSEIIWKVCPQLQPLALVPSIPSKLVEGISFLPYDYDSRILNFLDEYLGSEEHPVPFGGRDNVLQTLGDWLEKSVTPFLLLTAPAGRGKSALLVRWLAKLLERNDIVIAFVPISVRFGTNMARVFYGSLAARLAFLHGDPVPASPSISTEVYQGLVDDYLRKPLVDGRTLLLILDGLDEAGDWQPGADFLPRHLPSTTRIVVSARYLAGDVDSQQWQHRLNWDRKGLSATLSLLPLSREGLLDVLQRMGFPIDGLGRHSEIVAELYRLSDGDPLLVNLYVNDMWKKGDKVVQLQPKELKNIQPGYEGYFSRWWDEQKKLWGKEKPWLDKHVRTIRNLLAGAMGPLFPKDIKALVPELKSDDIEDALSILKRLIIGDDKTRGYTYSHSKLRDYFWEKLNPDGLDPKEQDELENLFIARGEQTLQDMISGKIDPTNKKEIPVYVVQHFAAHLIRGRQPIEKLLELIDHPEWAEAWFTVEGSYDGYMQDVQRVWDQCKLLDRQFIKQCGKASYLGKQMRCALIKASLSSLAGNTPAKILPILVREGIWTRPQVWAFIRQMPDVNKAEAISAFLPNLSDEELLRALEVARSISEPKLRAHILCKLVQMMPTVSKEALAAVHTLRDEVVRSNALAFLVQYMPESHLENALEAAQTIHSEPERARVLSILSLRLPTAIEALRAIGHEQARVNALAELAEYFPELTREVLAAVQRTPDDALRANALNRLAQDLSEAELGPIVQATSWIQSNDLRTRNLIELAHRLPQLRQEARKAIRAIPDEIKRTSALIRMGKYMPEALDDVWKAARASRDESRREGILGALAECLVEIEPEQALKITLEIRSELRRAHLLSKLVLVLSEQKLENVLETARSFQDEYARAIVLGKLALRLPELLGEALEIARTIRNESKRASVLIQLAEQRPEITEEILQTIRGIHDEESRLPVIRELAPYLPEALAAVRAIEDDLIRAKTLGFLARHQPDLAREALESARAIADEEERSLLLCQFAQHLSEAEFRQLLAAMSTIDNDFLLMRLIRGLAESSPARELSRVLESTRGIKMASMRAEVLAVFVHRLPDVELEKLLQAVRGIHDEWVQAEVLEVLVQSVADTELEKILLAARRMSNEKAQASVLAHLAQRFPDQQRRQIVTRARHMKDKVARAKLLGNLIQHIPDLAGEALVAARAISDEWERARTLKHLIEHLPKEKLIDAYKAAQTIRDPGAHATVLAHLARQLPEFTGEALAAARKVQDAEVRASVFGELSQRVPELSAQALDAAEQIAFKWGRAITLSRLAQCLPTEDLGRVLEIARSIRDESMRARVLSVLMQRLSGPQLWPVLQAVFEIPFDALRVGVLIDLIGPMQKTNVKDCYLILENAMVALAQRRRAALLSDIAPLLPVFLQLSSKGADREVFLAMNDVMDWWK